MKKVIRKYLWKLLGYNYFVFLKKTIAQELGKPIQTGVFGADMKVALINDGPVTILIDSKNKE